MPLYSKVEKRLAKKAKDEASGMAKLKAAVREELGEGSSSSGSSESGSDSEQDSGDDDDEEEQEDGSDEVQSPAVGRVASVKRKRTDASEDEGAKDEEDGEDGEDGEEEDSELDEEEEEESDDDFDMTIEQVSAEPIYTTTSAEGQEVDTCVLCPGKVLKNPMMVGVHKGSNSHRRAVKRWERYLAEHADKIDADTDPRAIVQDIQDGISTQLSKPERPKRSQKATSGKPPQSSAERSKARKEKIQKKVEEKVREVQKTGDASGLNRKARRLLAQQEKDKAKSKAS